MDYMKWNVETDVIAEPLKPSTHWAYSINTELGQYRKEIQKNCNKTCVIDDVENLVLQTETEVVQVLKNVTVWPMHFYDTFMIFHENETSNLYLIDSRGIIFRLPCRNNIRGKWTYGNVKINKREGCYVIDDEINIYFRSAEQRESFKDKSKPFEGITINKDFNRFVRNNAHNENRYLYLTAGKSKCGSLIQYFALQGMKYEIVPNLLCDDDTLNVRIPLDENNSVRKDVQFLCEKYQNTYAIYGIPFNEVGGALIFPEKYKQVWYELNFFIPKGKEAMIYSVSDTIRNACNAKDDYDLYKKSFAKIRRLLLKGKTTLTENYFSNIKLLYPNDYKLCDEYVLSRIDYINELLLLGVEKWKADEKNSIERINNRITQLTASGIDMSDFVEFHEKRLTEVEKGHIDAEEILAANKYDNEFFKTRHFSTFLYSLAYDESVLRYKDTMANYESEVILKMAESGIKINRWKNEADLFVLVKKEYPSAVYQYRTTWLGQQSIDIYIPELGIGIEYQGEQHYKAIDFFGGEEAFKKLVERDERKAKLCNDNDVHLIYWNYDEVISKGQLKKKIDKVDSKRSSSQK